MPEATPRPSLRRFAVPAAIAAAFAAGALLTWTATRPEAPPAPPEPPRLDVPPPLPAPVLPPPPLGRADLLAAGRAATAAYAAGAPPPEGQAALIGRRFQLRVPFGCAGPLAEAGPGAGWRYDPARQTLTLTARPVVWTEAPLVREAAGADEIEAVEGFWIPRPWAEDEACPPAPTSPTAATTAAADSAPAPQTLGLASVFRAGGSRVLRRGERPYEVVRKVAPADFAAAGGFRLVLSGRIAALGDGQPVACRAERADQRPVCLIAVELDRVAFEDAAGAVVAEWAG